MKTLRKAIFSSSRPRHPISASDQIRSQGNASGRGQASHPICDRRGARRRHRADDLRHRPRQRRAGGLFRHRFSSLRRRCASVTKPRSWRRLPAPAWCRAGSPMCASRSRWALATPSGARATSSATNPSPCCFRTNCSGTPATPASSRWPKPTTSMAATSYPCSKCPRSTPIATVSSIPARSMVRSPR